MLSHTEEYSYNWRTVIADDHAILRFSIRSIIEGEGLCRVVAEASSGREAIARCAALEPDLVLLDVSMPGDLDGIGAARLIRDQRPGVKIIALTAHQDAALILRAFGAGVDGFIHKSGNEHQLRAAIHATMRGENVVPAGASGALIRQVNQPGEFGGLRFAPRELEVLRLTATGASVKETAFALGIEEATVRGYRKTVARKIGRSGAGALARFYLENSGPLAA